MSDFLLSCDWGSSSFRLRLVDAQHRVVDEVLSDQGAACLYSVWKKSDMLEEPDIEKLYYKELLRGIRILESRSPFDLRNAPVAISGMASSVMGIRELPYAPLPFTLDGRGAIIEPIPPSEDFPHKIFLVSGVSGKGDVMRGEETQIVGLASGYRELCEDDHTLCIFPGTHSKHIHLHRGSMCGFHTYMTGELFYVMTHHSMLKDAVSVIEPSPVMRDSLVSSFCRGVDDAGNYNLLHSLFTVRVNQLFHLLEKEENFYYLSGLLIGAELSSIPGSGIEKIILCSGSNVFELYKQAMQQINGLSNIQIMEAGVMDRAVVNGHVVMLQHLLGR